MQAWLAAPFERTEEAINELAEEVDRGTACRRCKIECPLGIDHGLITHLARGVLSEVGIVPKAVRVATREQLDGKTRNTSAIPAAAMIEGEEDLDQPVRPRMALGPSFSSTRSAAGATLRRW